MSMKNLKDVDPDVYQATLDEEERTRNGVELIPSENYTSKAVLQAMGTVFTNKYSEGYPGRRYYGGNEVVDRVERLAIERAKELFGAEHVNVQPYSGSPANHAVFLALLDAGDKFMGLDLSCGGHLTHGSPVNYSGIRYNAISYYVDKETERLDMDQIRKQAIEEKPKIIISSLSAYPRELPFKEFQEICEEVDAYHLADIAHIAGLIVGGEHPSPFPYTDIVTTTTHKTLRGPRGAIIMCKKEDRLKEVYHPDSRWNLARLIDRGVFPGLQGGPHDHITAAKAVCFKEALQPDFKKYAVQIRKNAKAMADELMAQGLKLVTNGTDNHLMLIDMRPSGLTGKGKQIEKAMDKAGITLNKNSVPFDEASMFNPSGLRLGTPAITTRGMKEGEMREIARCIARVIEDYKNDTVLKKVKEDILELVKDFPLYQDLGVLK